MTHQLEGISKTLVSKYSDLITELIGTSPGIYALYNDGELYYVGKSTDLKRRVGHHLRDRHVAAWSHFSLYLVRRESHISEIESLVVKIANPRGNKVTPRLAAGKLMKTLRRAVRAKQREELNQLFPDTRRTPKRSSSGSRGSRRDLTGLVSRRTPLYGQYKGKEYKAHLNKTGMITFRGKRYPSPSAAAKAVVKRNANGWSFWYIKDKDGYWVRLRDFDQ